MFSTWMRRIAFSAFAGFFASALPLSCAGGQGGRETDASRTAGALAGSSDFLAVSAGPLSPSDQVVADACRAYLESIVELSPERATLLGIHTRDGELDDRSAAAGQKALESEKAMLASLRAQFAEVPNSPVAKTDLALLTHALSVAIAVQRETRPLERKPEIYLEPLSAIFAMTARSYAPDGERARAIVTRMERIPAVVAAAKANLKNPPKVWTQVGIEKAASAAAFFEEVRPFLERSLAPSERPHIDAAVKTAKDAYADYKVFLERDVLPRSNGDFAAGRDLFNYLLRENYFLEEDADALREMGLRVMAKTQAQMNELARRLEPKAKGWPEVAAHLKKLHPTAADLLPAYRSEVLRARAFLVARDVVAMPPGDTLDVVETPPFLRTTTIASYDQPAPFENAAGSAKGFFYVTLVDKSWAPDRQEEWLRENDYGDIVDTAVHEAYPGHHLQLSWARRNPSIIRRIVSTDLFSEGWALYAEELMAELGYYDDAKRLMQLQWTLVRAARIVIDVGLHTRGMSFDEAVRILTDEVHLERALAVSEVKRYTASPTQPLAYLTGREMILKMRAEYKEREGTHFSLKAFHSEVLARGTIPPGLIAREMRGSSR